MKSINCLLSSSLKPQTPAAASTNTIKIRNNIQVPNAKKLWYVCVHTGGSVRIWLIGEKSRLIIYNIIFRNPVYLFTRSSFMPGQRWQLSLSGQQCPSRDSRIFWGVLMSLQALRPLTSGSDSPDAFTLLSTRKLHFALTVLPGGSVFTQRRSLPPAVWNCIRMRGLAKAG